ncbi:hypothetical protein F751_1434 [Auxenochlorella protothecoides]|uniref:Uncharacterized protein n=1 Tax=Auxenochlorella protothecoides TaxID=3075 RepID=A0A087SJB6_AUXPR|nr:hypothetical protein F751_1434 [Auxenochlorella protothecoides]KFM25820.1 hypothetical protein F751_1434 [Auxenochlorella protothecoides]
MLHVAADQHVLQMLDSTKSQAVETGEGQENGEGGDHAGGEEDGARKRRRRGDGVDYVALNKLLEEESAGTKQA